MQKGLVGLGVIGCGNIGARMIEAFRDVKGGRLVGIADVNVDRAREIADRYGAKVATSDYQELLERDDIDAILVATPNFLHAKNAIDAAKAGKHVLVQKPMALSIEDADQMIFAARENNVILMSCFILRFTPSFAKAKELIDSGVIGKPLVIRTNFSHWGIYKAYKPASDWFYEKSKSGGGPLLDLGVHHFDLLRWITGNEVEEVMAQTATIDNPIEVEDNAFVNLKFSNGIRAQLFLSFTTANTSQAIEVYGTDGTIIAGPAGAIPVPLRLYTVAGNQKEAKGFVEVPVPNENSFTKAEQHFVDCILEGKEPMTTGIDGKKTIEIIQAAYRSAEHGKIVKLDPCH
ncbi:MAG TPA: Gfo/Idh/MocA family oxidoreductase [Firmicutes bacterium]|nr:Gfo/Idh/MocA family oxidoreductase [Bacillota bacterium]